MLQRAHNHPLPCEFLKLAMDKIEAEYFAHVFNSEEAVSTFHCLSFQIEDGYAFFYRNMQWNKSWLCSFKNTM